MLFRKADPAISVIVTPLISVGRTISASLPVYPVIIKVLILSTVKKDGSVESVASTKITFADEATGEIKSYISCE